jgi:hypothetical protein
MIYYYTLFTLFAIIITMMIVDPNVTDYIYLIGKIIKVKLERFYWMIRFHPAIISSPIGKWWMMRKYMRTAEKLAQELSQKQQDGV